MGRMLEEVKIKALQDGGPDERDLEPKKKS